MLATESERVEVPVPPSTGSGMKLLVNPDGTVADSVTGEVKPRSGETVIVDVPEAPDAMMRPDVLVASAKSAGCVTVRVIVVEWKVDVEFPITIIV